MPNIRDVAKLVGVALITVSRVINNSGYITDETHQRVDDVIRSLGYAPNSLARSLHSHNKRMLALVLTDITKGTLLYLNNSRYIILGNITGNVTGSIINRSPFLK